IAMEYILGETMQSIFKVAAKQAISIPPPFSAAVIASAAEALHFAHELKSWHGSPLNVVHRDVSPQNVMVSYGGRTKIVDFGIAKADTGRANTQFGVIKGKFSYMSPEQISGGKLDRRSDVYSLGIVLYEALLLRPLYRGQDPSAVAAQITSNRVVP